ncbi:MAG: AsmA family protein [Desulfuromonadaceae bacterium]|nr:AsmA family protein [Desulfuromonadaceae bacterium]
MQRVTLRHARLIRLVAIIALGVIFAGSSTVIALYFLATPDKISTTLIPVLEEKLNCEVKFSRLEVNLLSGVKLNDLTLADKGEIDPWFQVDKAVLSYRILPLLRGRIVIDEVRLDTPRVVVLRNADGSITAGNILDQRKSQRIESSGVEEVERQVDFYISTISVANAEVLIRDFTFGDIPRLTRLQEVGLQLKDFASNTAWRFILWGKLNGTPVDIEGSVDPRTASGSCKLVLDELNLVSFQPYYRDFFPFLINRMGISTDCRIDFNPSGLHLSGDLRVINPDVSPATSNSPSTSLALNSAGFSASEITTNVELAWEHKHRHLNILRMDGGLDGLGFGVKGTADFNTANPVYALDVKLQKWPVHTAVAYASAPLLDAFEQYAPAGTCTVAFSWRREVKNAHGSIHSARINLTDAGLNLGRLRLGLSGVLELHGDKLSAPDLSGRVAGQNVRLALYSENWRARRPHFRLNVQGGVLNCADLSAADRLRGETRQPGTAVDAASTSEPGPYSFPFDLSGRFGFKTLKYRTVELQEVSGSVIMGDSILNLEQIQAGFASGILKGTFSLDMRLQGFSYRGNFEGTQLSTEQLLSALQPGFGGTIKGLAHLSANFSGAGTQPLRARQNLSADIGLSIENGTLRDIKTLNVVSQQLNIPSLTTLNLAAASVDIEIKTVDRLKFTLLGRNEKLRVDIRGDSSWQGQTQGRLRLHLVPELARELRPEYAPNTMLDENGMTLLDCVFRGSVRNPELASGFDLP